MSTDWEAAYRAGNMPWNKGEAAPPLVDWLLRAGHPLNGEVLVPGCGLGHEVRAVAALAQARQVCGLDLSETALALARQHPRVGSETYVQADLFALPAEWNGRFDWVVEHTCFCAIEPRRRREYVLAVAQILKDGGHLLAIFYLDPWKGEEPPERGGPPFGTNRDELGALFNPHFELLSEAVPPRTFRGREGAEIVRLLRKKS